MERPFKRITRVGRFARVRAPVNRAPAAVSRALNFNVPVSRRRAAVGAKRTGLTRRVGYYGRYGPAKNQLVGRNTPEVKFFDYQLGTDAAPLAVPTTVGSPYCICLIAQGAGEQQRIGRKCFVKSIQIHVMVNIPVAAAVYDDYVHVWLVQDTQTNGAAAAWTEIMTSEVVGAGTSNLNPAPSGSGIPGLQMRVMANSERFKILWHAKLDVNHAFAAGTGIETADGFIKCAIPLEFNGSTGIGTELKSNSLSIYWGAMKNAASYTLKATTRLRFGDT